MTQFGVSGGRRVQILAGDLTAQDVDAIVNAANEGMLGGGGVDGAIHRAAGPELVAACRAVPEVRPRVRCPTGEARITPGFRLAARHVIHTVGPVYHSAEASAPLLASAVRSSLALAREAALDSIAFPAISCGVYRYPPVEAARICLSTVRDFEGGPRELRFVLFGPTMYRTWEIVARQVLAAGDAMPPP